MKGIVLINKPIGPSSFQVIRRLRKASGLKKIGHAGTLDPKASGLIVAALGPYTKLIPYLMSESKVYRCQIRLGQKSDSDDCEGKIIKECSVSHLSASEVEKVVKKFEGEIFQAPPKFSAIKVDGQRAYTLARTSEDFSLKKRLVTIFSIKIQSIELPFVNLNVHCSKGTYIRSLARDIGDELGVCGLASKIERTQSGHFRLSDAINLDDLDQESLQQNLKQDETILGNFPQIKVSELLVKKIRFGQDLNGSIHFDHEKVAAVNSNEVVAILCNDKGKIGIDRVI